MSAELRAALLLSAAAAGLCAAPARAVQSQGSRDQVLEATATAPSPAAASTPEPPRTDTPADRFGFPGFEQLQISTGTDDDNLTLRVALPASPSVAHRFSLTAATPLHGGDDAMPASLDALANGSRVTLSWGYFPLRIRRPGPATERMVEAARNSCIAEHGREHAQCYVSHEVVYLYDRPNWLRYLRLMTASVTDYGIDATVGINDFDWVDPVSLLPLRDRRTDWSVAGHVTHFLRGQQTALTGSIAYQRAYEAAEEQQICRPNAIDPAAECVTARGAAPSRNENLLISAGLRYRLVNADGTLGRLAVAPLLTFDAIDDVWGVDVPVYFIPGENGSLTGGVRLGYRSDRADQFSVGVFVGTTFDFWGR